MGNKRRKDGFIYEELVDGNIAIVDYDPKEPSPVLIFPDEINGKRVTQIGLNTFVDSGNYVEKTKKAIAKQAVKKVVIPKGVNTITPFSYYCFCNVETIVISSGLSLENIRRLNLLCVRRFEVTDDNGYYSADDGVLFSADKEELICYPIGKPDKEYAIPEGTLRIGEQAFSNFYKKLSSKVNVYRTVLIPQSVRSIEREAFWDVNVSVSFSEENHIDSLGKKAFLRGFITENSDPVFPNLKLYKGNSFPEESLCWICLSPDCVIEYNAEIDYREYLLFNAKNMIAKASIDVGRFSFSYSDNWYEGKYGKHHFVTTIGTEKASLIVDLLGIKGLEAKDETLIYTFSCNPQKMYYGERTYKKYLDGFKKILECL